MFQMHVSDAAAQIQGGPASSGTSSAPVAQQVPQERDARAHGASRRLVHSAAWQDDTFKIAFYKVCRLASMVWSMPCSGG
jgi:hypothetical protein